MKSFLIALLVLVGCASTPIQPVSPKENPIPITIARGTDGRVNWNCTIEELNDKLVWIPCEFHNTTAYKTNVCINVTFFDQITMRPIVSSRKVCSGTLDPNEKKENYAAFIKEKRHTLQRCGELLNLCVMLAGPDQILDRSW